MNWLIKLIGQKENKGGGIIPETKEEMQRAKDADLITLPRNIQGTNCGNCKFINKNKEYCDHSKVLQKVNERMCCVYWDAEGSIRPWREK